MFSVNGLEMTEC